jgi:hypothetical protein
MITCVGTEAVAAALVCGLAVRQQVTRRVATTITLFMMHFLFILERIQHDAKVST